MRYYLAHWARYRDGAGFYWAAPAMDQGLRGLVDMRPRSARDLALPPVGFGFFAYEAAVDPAMMPGQIDMGGDLDGAILNKRGVQNALGFVMTGQTVKDALWEILTTASDPEGVLRPKPLMPRVRGDLPLFLAGEIRNERFDLQTVAHRPQVIDLLQRDYREIRAEALRHAEGDPRREAHLRVLARWEAQYRETYRTFIPADLPDEGTKEPRTTFSDSFNRADNTDLNAVDTGKLKNGGAGTWQWTEVAGNVEIQSNTVRNVGSGVSYIRAEDDTSGADTFTDIVRVRISVLNGDQHGACTRFQPDANDSYMYMRNDITTAANATLILRETTAGSRSNIGTSDTVTSASGEKITCKADGSTISGEHDDTEYDSVTSTTHTGHTRGGIYLFDNAVDDHAVDSWAFEDIAAGGIDYTLAADAGAFVLAGTAAALVLGRKVAADAGAFDVAGSDAGLTFGGKIQADPGGFDLVGQDAGLVKGYVLPADAGAHSMVGTSASLVLGRKIAADGGVFDMAGQDAALTWAASLSAAAGSFDLAGQDADLILGYVLAAIAGAYDLAGQDAGLATGQSIAADGGAFDLAGSDAALILGLNVEADAGAFDMAGADAGLRWAAKLVAEAGAYTFEGQDVDLLHTIAGLAAVLFPPNVVDASPRRWKVDAERTWKIDAPGRRFRVDDDL